MAKRKHCLLFPTPPTRRPRAGSVWRWTFIFLHGLAEHESLRRSPTNRERVPPSLDSGSAIEGRHSADAHIAAAADISLIGGAWLPRIRARPASSQIKSLAQTSSTPNCVFRRHRIWPGIETEADAEERNDERADALRPRVPKIARKLVSCDGDSRGPVSCRSAPSARDDIGFTATRSSTRSRSLVRVRT